MQRGRAPAGLASRGKRQWPGYREAVTAKRTTAEAPALDGLAASLADIVCWLVFYLQRCSSDELDLDVAESLLKLVSDALRRLPVTERLVFLEHATTRAEGSSVADYQDFLLDLAETMGLE